MIILKLMALSILIPAYIWEIARLIQLREIGAPAIVGVIYIIITGTVSAAIIQTML